MAKEKSGRSENGAVKDILTEELDPGMTRADAGSLGGQTTKARYGSEHYRSIGRKGGAARGR